MGFGGGKPTTQKNDFRKKSKTKAKKLSWKQKPSNSSKLSKKNNIQKLEIAKKRRILKIVKKYLLGECSVWEI